MVQSLPPNRRSNRSQSKASSRHASPEGLFEALESRLLLSVNPSSGLDPDQAGPMTDPAGSTQVETGTLEASGPIRTASDLASDPAVVTDANLMAAFRTALSLASNVTPTVGQLASLQTLSAANKNIANLKGLEYCVGLQQITLNGNRIADLTPLKDLPMLWSLNLSSNLIVNLAPLAGLSHLTDLQLNGNQIVDLTPLKTLTGLISLSLNNNKILDLTPLKSLTNLTSLSLNSNSVTNGTITTKLADLTPLKVVPAAGDTPLQGMASLTSLSLSGNQIIDVTALGTITTLTSLTITSNPLVNIAPLATLTNLTTLNLDSNQIVSIAAVNSLTNLTTLSLNGNQIVDLPALDALTNLTGLSLNSNKIVDVTALGTLTALTSLSATSNQIVDLTPLAGLTTLITVDLSYNKIVDVTALTGLTSLATLKLQYNLITDVQALVDNAGLTGATDTVNLVHNPLTADQGPIDMAALVDRLVVATYTTRVAPVANAVKISHPTIRQGRTITLTVLDSDITKHDPLALQKVEFYCDVDNDLATAGLEANELIYTDSNPAGGWTWAGPVTWAADPEGSLTFYARVIDEWDDVGAFASVETTVLPANTAPVSESQSVRMAGTSSIDVTLVASDAETAPLMLTYEVAARPVHGTATIKNNVLTYTPAAGFFGTETLTFKAYDGLDHSNVSNVTIVVPLVASAGRKVSYYDANDDLVTVKLTGPGQALVYAPSGQGYDASEIVLKDTTAASSVTVSAPGKAPTVNFDQIKLDGGSLKSFAGRWLNLTGDVTVVGDGGFGALTLGDVTDAGEQTIELGAWSKPTSVTLGSVSNLNLSSDSPIQSLTVGKWLDTNAADSITAPWIGALTVRGDFQPDLTLSNPGSLPLALRSAKISGTVDGATWAITGGVGTISAGAWAADGLTAGTVKSLSVNGDFSGAAAIAGDVGKVTVKGDFGGTLAARSVKSMSVTGDLADATVNLDLALGGLGLGSLKVGGWIRNTDILAKASLGAITAGGIQDSNVFAGVTGFGGSPIADDKCDLNEGAMLKSLTIKGTQLDGDFAAERSNWGAWQIGTVSLAYPNIDDPAGDLAMTGTFSKGSYKGVDGKTHNLINVLQSGTPDGLQILELI